MNPWIAIPFLILIVLRALQRNSLTPVGLLVAILTATIHSLHPSPLPFTLLGSFFLVGTLATKIHHTQKATLTLSSAGGTGAEGPRTHIQVLANSGVATILILAHVYNYGVHFSSTPSTTPSHLYRPGETLSTNHNSILLWGIIANYAAVTSDTLSSELGILSTNAPRLITSFQTVPRGTNGGVTPTGLLAGIAGATLMGIITVILTGSSSSSSSSNDTVQPDQSGQTFKTLLMTTSLGALGTLLDSLLGATLQASVIDGRTGKVIEGVGGVKVLTRTPRLQTRSENQESRRILRTAGRDWLDNNQINILTAMVTSMIGMGVGVCVNG